MTKHFERWERIPKMLTQTPTLLRKRKGHIKSYLKCKTACDQLRKLHPYRKRNNTDKVSSFTPVSLLVEFATFQLATFSPFCATFCCVVECSDKSKRFSGSRKTKVCKIRLIFTLIDQISGKMCGTRMQVKNGKLFR